MAFGLAVWYKEIVVFFLVLWGNVKVVATGFFRLEE